MAMDLINLPSLGKIIKTPSNVIQMRLMTTSWMRLWKRRFLQVIPFLRDC
ncbi:hypothetical protein SAMN05216535_1643 [Stutzerimonas xanthomarina]|uniref:Uncharacterized protein n=2 Tax=Stutzerimonas xanthomarina TaxID=271420 RepID=A0A1M5PFY5_9GAMM|nr:hypothetical protein SAMN05216535_1643 [Stutzerimonas xanthomarina]SHH00724.1 hypothetical protein SAMN02744645_2168 [Stutzerimonas xanthomarina DSM 18231]